MIRRRVKQREHTKFAVLDIAAREEDFMEKGLFEQRTEIGEKESQAAM